MRHTRLILSTLVLFLTASVVGAEEPPFYGEVFQDETRLPVRRPEAKRAFPTAKWQESLAFFARPLQRSPSEVDLARGLAAQWPVVDRPKEIPASEAPRLGKEDFTLAAWVQADDTDRLPGDLISQYDPGMRRGFHLTLKSNTGTTSHQANWRHLQFGIDDNLASEWRDCGRPGHAILAFALTVHEGMLYAGTCEPGKEESGRVYRYAGGTQWIDCGAPDRANSVTSLAVYQGQLFAGTGKYRLGGSRLKESENQNHGGRVFRYEGGTRWSDCGQLPDTEALGGFVVYQNQLHATSLYRPAGFFRYEGETKWIRLPAPLVVDPKTQEKVSRRVNALTVHEGYLYASSYDGGDVYRFDGKTWTDCGRLGENTQTYSFAQYQGRLYVGTWPSGRIYRLEDVGKWTDVGRLGEELEVMGMLVHNGRLLAGSLPLAEVYSYEGPGTWKKLARLDHTPDVTYRRAWTMAEHEGQVFCSTLPSGKIFAFSAGHQASWGHSLPPGWHHVVASKSAGRLSIFVDGKRVSQTPVFDPEKILLDSNAPLQLGHGMNGPLNGKLADVRIYRRALNLEEIGTLSKMRP